MTMVIDGFLWRESSAAGMAVVAFGDEQVGCLLARLGHIGLVSERRMGLPEIDIILQLFLGGRGTRPGGLLDRGSHRLRCPAPVSSRAAKRQRLG
jgi:hypothetical protein